MAYPFFTTNKSNYFSRSGDIAFYSCDYFLIKTKTLLEKHKNINQDRFTIALVLSRKTGNAVLRNKMKRQLRVIFTNLDNNIHSNYVFVLIARPKISALSFTELKTEVNFALGKIQKRIKIYKS